MRPLININTRAMRSIERRLARYPERIREQVLRQAGELIVAEAQEEAPVKTGFLRNSDFVEDNDDGTVTAGFGAEYGLAVHETHPTRSGFLRRTVLEKLPRIMRKLLDEAVRRERP